MRVERALVGLLCVLAVALGGCGGQLAYNLPPASRLMEPGPGVGGPGPGVIPPAGNPYGIYGGAVGRFGDGMGGYVGGGYGAGACEPYAANTAPPTAPTTPVGADQAVMQASFNCAPGGYPGEACMCEGGMCEGGMCEGGMCEGGMCEGGMCEGGMCEGGMCEGGTCDGGMGCGPACGCGGACGGGCPIGNCCSGCGGAPGCCICNALQGLIHGGGGHGRPGSVEACADGAGMGAGMATSQIAFLGEEGVQVTWDVGGYGMFDSTALVIPGRQDFYQGAIYRLKLTNIPGRPGVELYPTLEVAPVTPRTDAYLAHSPIPVQFTEEDFDQVLSGNFVTKVIYLPDPEFQELALAGVETLVSTRLDPGVDPIAEADRRGSILAIVRMGNKDLEPGYNDMYGSEQVSPASYTTQSNATTSKPSYESRAVYNEAVKTTQAPDASEVVPAQYGEPCDSDYTGGYYGGGSGDGSAGSMPMGMPTSGFAPPAMPPNYMAGAPQWGMPITGTPIGLPGPPHIPLGTPAGLRQHVMHNRTRVLMPPPVAKMKVTVKQRPGMNYPRPVNHVQVNETQREPLRLIPGWLGGLFHHHRAGAGYEGAYGDPNCQ